MEVPRGRRSRDHQMSPERVKICPQPRGVIRPTFKRVQVVYYLTRNGQLEHPHYMEVTHLATQPLRLKDVINRLTVLRGKGMSSLYSWSCKRSYKNGYVWNDLAENDKIYPSEGDEYVLKGSEVFEGCTEKFQQLQVGSAQQFQQLQLGNTQLLQSTNFQLKRKQGYPKRHLELQQVEKCHYEDEAEENEEEVEGDDDEYEEKISYTTTAPHSRCSRGVSTDELEQKQQQKRQEKETLKNPITELTLEDSSPPSTTSSTLSDKANEISNNTSKRFEDGDPMTAEPLLSRNSVLFQLIACGGGPLSFRKSVPVAKEQPPPAAVARKSNCSELHKGVLCKTAAVKAAVEEADVIRYMSENPRFGNLQAEEKEYFSGSIVESMSTEERAQIEPCLKKSSSYNEERGSKAAPMEAVEEETKREKALKGKCIPRKKSSSK